MNCDQVFAVLTRGPFPTGAPTDRRVEAHLEACRSCRRLAEALRADDPPDEEAVSPEESRTLPGYRGPAPFAARSSLRVLASDRVGPPRPRAPMRGAGRRTDSAGAVVRGALWLLTGLALGVLASGVWKASQRRTAAQPPGPALVLPAALPCAGQSAPGGATRSACCLACHERDRQGEHSPHARGALARACRACHFD
jgi:hypothetical protein